MTKICASAATRTPISRITNHLLVFELNELWDTVFDTRRKTGATNCLVLESSGMDILLLRVLCHL